MYSEPRKIVLTGLVVSAVAIGAYVSQTGRHWLSADDTGLTRDDDSPRQARGDTITGAVTAGPVVAGRASVGPTSGELQAARNSLKRNDLAAAQAQLDAVRASHQNDEQVLALRREVQARAERAQQVAAAENDPQDAVPTRASTPARTSSASGKSGRYAEHHRAGHERSGRASSYAHDQRTFDTWVAGFAGNDAASVGAPRAGGAPMAATNDSPPPTLKVGQSTVNGSGLPPLLQDPSRSAQVVPRPPTAPVAPVAQSVRSAHIAPSSQQAELAAPPATPAAVAQTETTDSTQAKTNGGPKTRAQVQAEIIRARGDGSLPAFGNPDPAGPGGAPSLVVAPRP